MPDDITTATVCKKSGKRVVAGLCDADPRGSMATTEYFAEGSAPTGYCDHHVNVSICAETGMLATDLCPMRTGGVYITGGSPGSADGPYLISEGSPTNTCPMHAMPELPPMMPEQTMPVPPTPEQTMPPENQPGANPGAGADPGAVTDPNQIPQG